ncbi:MAG: GTP-dependent dephospho-CoA kinase family protein [Nitrosotalea sp.]
MRLPESLRDSLKEPMGILLQDSEATKENILKTIPKDAFLITVGDATTEKMIKFGLVPSLQIVDSVEKRQKRDDILLGQVDMLIRCTNPAAQITDESINVIKNALEEDSPLRLRHVRILVDGEEDLLVLPAVLHAPENSVIMYGQPNEGLVIVLVNHEIREQAKKIMDLMI